MNAPTSHRQPKPRISLALPVYNGEEFIAEAIESILDQDFSDFELIITDNASTDRTRDICLAYAARDTRILYVRNEQNLGAAANFNLGFRLSSGEYFKWCAHDDLISRNYLAACARLLDERSDAVTAYGKLIAVDEQGCELPYIEAPVPDMSRVSAGRRFRLLVRRQGLDAAIFGLHRRDALARTSLHLPYYSSECALLAELALLGPFVFTERAVLYNRDHPARSVNLHSSKRLVWQTPRASRANAMEFTRRLVHLASIAWQYRDRASASASLAFLAVWSLHPIRSARVGLELIGLLSPAVRDLLRRHGLRGLNRLSAAGRQLLGRDAPLRRAATLPMRGDAESPET